MSRPGCPVRRQGFGLRMSCRKDPLPVPGIARDTRKLPAGGQAGQGRRARFLRALADGLPEMEQGPRYLELHWAAHFPEHSLVHPYGILGPASPTRPLSSPAATIRQIQCLPAQIHADVGKNLQGRKTNEDSLCSLPDRFAAGDLPDCVRLGQVTDPAEERQDRFRTIVRDPKGFFPLHIEEGEQFSLREPAV